MPTGSEPRLPDRLWRILLFPDEIFGDRKGADKGDPVPEKVQKIEAHMEDEACGYGPEHGIPVARSAEEQKHLGGVKDRDAVNSLPPVPNPVIK